MYMYTHILNIYYVFCAICTRQVAPLSFSHFHSISFSLSFFPTLCLSVYLLVYDVTVYTYICICICVCIHIYTHVYIHIYTWRCLCFFTTLSLFLFLSPMKCQMLLGLILHYRFEWLSIKTTETYRRSHNVRNTNRQRLYRAFVKYMAEHDHRIDVSKD